MSRVVCHASVGDVPHERDADDVHVVLYGAGTMPDGVVRIGGQLLDPTSRFGIPVTPAAFDFLTIAMAVTAADTFVLRDETDDRWRREIELSVPVAEPARWRGVRSDLESLLGFLSGDRWSLDIQGDGPTAPGRPAIRRRRRLIDLSRADCACLFSGGLDSYVGVLDLLDGGRRPMLVSHAYRGDSQYQRNLSRSLPRRCERFAANANPTGRPLTDVSMRTRSFNFLAYGAISASAIAEYRTLPSTDLIVPENGHIALNPPLTPRRIGSSSTRTTHPHFLSGMNALFDATGLPVKISNPLRLQTKGETLMRRAADRQFAAHAASTVSCGKWKRKNQQCGRCVPCLIRRAAFQAAGMTDRTDYAWPKLSDVMQDVDGRDDLMSMGAAVLRADRVDFETWVAQSGPLPVGDERTELVEVFRRGLAEMRAFLQTNGRP